uniref:Uncharacterized protein n=1 Tax=viral metagenome TaxID=1070528 RepID=A0A6C0D1H0_9ZZZZ
MISSTTFSINNEEEEKGEKGVKGIWLITLCPVHMTIPQYDLAPLSYNSYNPWHLNTWIPENVEFIKDKEGKNSITLHYNETNCMEKTFDEFREHFDMIREFFSKRDIELPIEIHGPFYCVCVIENSFSSSKIEESIDTSTFPISLREDLARIELMNQSFILSPSVMLPKMQTLVLSSTLFSTAWEIWFRLFQLMWYHWEAPFASSPIASSAITSSSSSSPIASVKPFPYHSIMYFQTAFSLFQKNSTQKRKNHNSICLPEWSLWYEKFLHLYYLQKASFVFNDGENTRYCFDNRLEKGMSIIHHVQTHLTLWESLPSKIRESFLTNIWYYLPRLTDSHFMMILLTPLVPRCQLSLPCTSTEIYSLLNPSMARDKKGRILVNARYSNYDVHTYCSLETEGRIYTKNYLFFIEEEEDRVQRKGEGYWLSPQYPRDEHAMVCGLEDVRLFWFRDGWWFTANCCDFKNHSKKPCVVIGKLQSSPDSNSEQWNTEFVCRLSFPWHETDCEKNWIPLIFGDQLFFIYSLSPFIMYQFPDSPSPTPFQYIILCDIVIQKSWDVPLFHSSFRGCGPFIPVSPTNNNSEFITISHEVIWINKKRHYMHRWFYLKMHPDFSIQLYCSNLFTLDRQEFNIQYSLGLCPSARFPERYYLSVSIMDENAGFFMIPTLDSIIKESKQNSLF